LRFFVLRPFFLRKPVADLSDEWFHVLSRPKLALNMNWDRSNRGDRWGQYCVAAAWASPVFPLVAMMSYCALPAIFAFLPGLFGFLVLFCLVGCLSACLASWVSDELTCPFPQQSLE
jgi:hypothetical protein